MAELPLEMRVALLQSGEGPSGQAAKELARAAKEQEASFKRLNRHRPQVGCHAHVPRVWTQVALVGCHLWLCGRRDTDFQLHVHRGGSECCLTHARAGDVE